MDEFVRLYQIVSLAQEVLVVAAAADNDEDKDDPENPATVVFATAIEKAYHCDGVNILQNNGEAAGQTVFHLHVHVIPRFKGDTVNIGWKQGDMPEDLDAICKEIQAQL